MNAAFLRQAKLCALLTTTSLAALAASPAQAQTGPDVPPPSRYATDEHGVDLARGTVTLPVTELSIGPGGPGGLAFTRRAGRSVRGHNYDLVLYGTSAGAWTASVGLTSYEFTASGSSFTSKDGKGATLAASGTNSWTLTLADGTVIVFSYAQKDSLDASSRKARGTSIKYPSGEEVTLAYRYKAFAMPNPDDVTYTPGHAVRLQSVSVSTGYQLHFDYAVEDFTDVSEADAWRAIASVTAINTTIDPCNATADNCTLTRAWPTVSYNGGSVTNALGETTVYTNQQGKFAIRRPGSAADDVTYNLDSASKVTSVVRQGLTWTYAYSATGNIGTITVTDPGNHQRVVTSDLAVGLPLSVKDELNRTTSYEYDTSGRLKKAIAPDGNHVEHTYDTRGNVTLTRAVPKGGSGPVIETSAEFPTSCTSAATCNKPIKTTDARGQVTDYQYEPHGGLKLVQAPAATANGPRAETRYTYTNVAPVTGSTQLLRLSTVAACRTAAGCAGTADEIKTIIAYNQANRLPSSTTTSAGTLTSASSFGYDGVGNVTAVDGPLAGTEDTVHARFDLLRRQVGSISPDPDGSGALKRRATRISFRPDGLTDKVETGTVQGTSDGDWSNFASLETAQSDYDAHGRLVRQKLVAGGAVEALSEMSYDGEGRLRCTAVRMNKAEFANAGADACALDAAGSHGPDRIVRTSYDAANQVTEVRSGLGTSVEAVDTATTYTPNGLVQTLTDGNSNVTTYTYDGHDRLSRTDFPATAPHGATYELLTYESLAGGARTSGLIASKRLRDGQTIGFQYDNVGRLKVKDLPGAEPDASYEYDLDGTMKSAAQGGQTLSFGHDALGRQVSETGPFGSTVSTLDIASRRTKLTYPGSGLAVDYDHLVTGEVAKIRENGATSGVGVLAAFGYDDLGRRISLTRGNGTSTSYGYDAVSRLQTLTQDVGGAATASDLTLGFGYNPAGQIASVTRSNDGYAFPHFNVQRSEAPNPLNQLASVNGAARTHDARGNLTADGTRSYGYSSENMLTTAAGGVTLAYDPLLRLHQVAGAGTVKFGYDGLDMIAEYNASNQLTRRHVHGPGADEPLVTYEGSGTTDRKFLHADERGSIVAVTDNAGAPLAINRYDEYGVPHGGNSGRFQYTGQAWLPEIGLYHYKARMYDPAAGRFLQADPIGYADGMNMYGYVGGDPVNGTDPSGNSRIDYMWEKLAEDGHAGSSNPYGYERGTEPGTFNSSMRPGNLAFSPNTGVNNWVSDVYAFSGAIGEGKLRVGYDGSIRTLHFTPSPDFESAWAKVTLASGSSFHTDRYRLSPSSELARAGITHIDLVADRFAHIKANHSEARKGGQGGWFFDVWLQSRLLFGGVITPALNRAHIDEMGSGRIKATGASGIRYGGTGTYGGHPDVQSRSVQFILRMRGGWWNLWTAYPVRP